MHLIVGFRSNTSSFQICYSFEADAENNVMTEFEFDEQNQVLTKVEVDFHLKIKYLTQTFYTLLSIKNYFRNHLRMTNQKSEY